jgi:hypothetical protein
MVALVLDMFGTVYQVKSYKICNDVTINEARETISNYFESSEF